MPNTTTAGNEKDALRRRCRGDSSTGPSAMAFGTLAFSFRPAVLRINCRATCSVNSLKKAQTDFRRHPPPSHSLAERLLDLLVGLVLAQRVHRPYRRRQPSDQGELEKQADDAGDRPANGEERQPRQNQGDQQTHFSFLSATQFSRPTIAKPASGALLSRERRPSPTPPGGQVIAAFPDTARSAPHLQDRATQISAQTAWVSMTSRKRSADGLQTVCRKSPRVEAVRYPCLVNRHSMASEWLVQQPDVVTHTRLAVRTDRVGGPLSTSHAAGAAVGASPRATRTFSASKSSNGRSHRRFKTRIGAQAAAIAQ